MAVNPVPAGCSCAGISWIAPTSDAPALTVHVGDTKHYFDTGFSDLELRYSSAVSTSVGTQATDAAVRVCYNNNINCENTNTKTFTSISAK